MNQALNATTLGKTRMAQLVSPHLYKPQMELLLAPPFTGIQQVQFVPQAAPDVQLRLLRDAHWKPLDLAIKSILMTVRWIDSENSIRVYPLWQSPTPQETRQQQATSPLGKDLFWILLLQQQISIL
jgi:hypothetical protein